MKHSYPVLFWVYIFGFLAIDSLLLASGPKDWPQWLGPNRNGISGETGILMDWPESGPEVVWHVEAGDGYSGMSVSSGKLYTLFGMASSEVLVCFDAVTGKKLWGTELDSKRSDYFGDGSRATPTVDSGLVYGLSAKGKLAALSAETGREKWKHDLIDEYGGKIPKWGVATSPLVYGDLLVVDVGGKDDHGIVAFNKNSGAVVWKSRSDLPGYSAPVAVSAGGIEQILVFTGRALVSVAPVDGHRYWSYEWRTQYDVNAATPVFLAPDKVFISSGYNKGAALLKILTNGKSASVEEVWKSRVMRNHFSTSLLLDGYLYGFDEKTLKCIDANTGDQTWAKRGFGKGSLIFADGHLIVLSDGGALALVEATPKQFVEKAKAQVLQGNRGRCWTVPALANGKLYLRNATEMLCLNFSK